MALPIQYRSKDMTVSDAFSKLSPKEQRAMLRLVTTLADNPAALSAGSAVEQQRPHGLLDFIWQAFIRFCE
jgi:hypothetical protein